MPLSNMQVYNNEISGQTIELLGQKINKFNAASGGAIQLSQTAWRGDYSKESFYQTIASAKRRVDRYAANATATPTPLSQAEQVAVKVAGGFGPILFEPSQLTWLQRNPGEAVMAISEGFANALLADQLNTGLLSAVSAIENNASVVNDVSATAAVAYGPINTGHSKFGDSSSMLVADIMTGSVYHRLVGQNLTNTSRLFEAGNVRVVDILGKIAVITDSPALYEAGTPNKDKVLSLVNGGLIIDNAGDVITNMETTNGNQRIETTWQADYTFGVKIKGYSWDIANGGPSPDDADLGTGSNWDQNVADVKHTAGTLTIGDAA